jgi:hypothetical protein
LRRDGGTGRRSGLKIRRAERPVGVRVPLSAPTPLYSEHSEESLPFQRNLSVAVRDPSTRSARSGFRLRSPASASPPLTTAKRLNLKSAGPQGLWGFESPSRHQHPFIPSTARSPYRFNRTCQLQYEILRLAPLAQDFACGLPLRLRLRSRLK